MAISAENEEFETIQRHVVYVGRDSEKNCLKQFYEVHGLTKKVRFKKCENNIVLLSSCISPMIGSLLLTTAISAA